MIYNIPVDDEGVITIPQELLTELNWEPGDEVEWIDNQDGSFTVKKLMEVITLGKVKTVYQGDDAFVKFNSQWQLDNVVKLLKGEIKHYIVADKKTIHKKL